MRKLLLLLAMISLVLASCTTFRWQIGQSTNAFFQLNKGHVNQFHLIKQSTEWTVYRTGGEEPIYFYFHYNALFQVDRGIRPPDLVIENR